MTSLQKTHKGKVATLDAPVYDPQRNLNPTAEHGWSYHCVANLDPISIIRELGWISDRLGIRVAGRAESFEEVIQPCAKIDAHPRSLSAHYGLGTLPFHTELSHRTKPCRYVLLGCIEPGYPSAATMLLNWRNLGFSKQELQLLETTPIFVRTGRRSFYSTILAPGGAFLRYDQGCIEALDVRGRNALRLVEDRIAGAASEVKAHHWRRGDILIIDNWHVLHGRSSSDHGTGRRLARILIDA